MDVRETAWGLREPSQWVGESPCTPGQSDCKASSAASGLKVWGKGGDWLWIPLTEEWCCPQMWTCRKTSWEQWEPRPSVLPS